MHHEETWRNFASEQRQHVNLSDYAHSIMETDIAAFQQGLKPSGFINRIIENYWDMSDASINHACEKLRAEHTLAAKRTLYRARHTGDPSLGAFDPTSIELLDSQSELIDMLVSDHAAVLAEKAASHPKGPAFKIRLQNRVHRMLYVEPFPELEHYRGNVGKYIKALMEDYSRLPFLEREAVFFRKNFEKLKAEVSLPAQSRRLLKIRLNPDPRTGSVSVYDMKPYDLMTDTGANFHYIVGMSRPAGDRGAERIPASIRLSRIDEIEARLPSYGSGKITAAERSELLAKLAERGVPYLVGETYSQKVELTPDGVDKYNRILHMRPASDPKRAEVRPNGNQILTFQCSKTQIRNYFLQFGKDAVILEPEDLAAEFRQHHKAAAETYADVKC